MKEHNFTKTTINHTPIEFKRTSDLHGMVYKMENCYTQAETSLINALARKLDSYAVKRSDYIFGVCVQYISVVFLKDTMCFKKGSYNAIRKVDTIYLYEDR